MNIRDKSPRANAHPGSVENSREAGRQSVAEKAQGLDGKSAAASDDPVVDRYRFIYHAVRTAPLPEPPDTFALQMERLTHDHPEQASLESWMLRLIVTASVAVGAVFGVPALATTLPLWLDKLTPLPWPLLLVSGIGLALAWLADRLLSQRALPTA